MINYLRNLVISKKGQGLSEYALILAGVAALAIVVVGAFTTGTAGNIYAKVVALLANIASHIN